MLTYAAAFLTATLLAWVTTPLLRALALRLGAVSASGGRNVNRREIPRLGGVAIACSTLGPLIILFFVQTEVARIVRLSSTPVVGMMIGAAAMCAMGALDDVRPQRAGTKLIIQVLVALLAYSAGFHIPSLYLPWLGAVSVGPLDLPLTLLWIVGITNAVNLIDGLDGLAAGIALCAAATNLVVAVASGAVLVAIVMAAMMGALFGFLYYNFNPARIFMGDSGSYFLGFTLATASLAGSQKASTAVSLLVPILALGLPIFDTLLSVIRRILERRSLFSPDRGHIHHKLLDLGLTHRRAVLALYSVSLLFALSALAISLGRDWVVGVALLVAALLVAGLVRTSRFVSRASGEGAPLSSTPEDEADASRRAERPR